jgi:hypothetical protein
MCCALFCHSKCSFFVIPSAFFCHSERERGIQYGCFASLSMTSALSFRALFFVIPSESEESSMDASLRLRSVQHDKRSVIPSALFLSFRALFFVIPSESEESSMDASLRLRSVQHDKCGVIPNALFLSFRALFFVIPSALFLSFRTLFFVIPSESEESRAMWMLHCACAPFSMTSAVSFRALFFCHSERERGIQYGCFTALALRSA